MENTVEQTARLLGRNHDIRFDRLMPGYNDRLKKSADQNHKPLVSRDFPELVIKICAFMFLSAVLIYGAASYYGSIISQGGHSTNTVEHQIIIGDDLVNAPENMIRFNSQRTSGGMSRLDLYAHWPSMSGYTDSLSAEFNSTSPDTPILYVSLEPRDMSKDMSGRVTTIYETFFSGPPVDAGNGLVRRAFSANSAYFSEDLYYEAGSPYPFAARCIRESDKVAGSFCIRDIHIGRDLMLTYRFHASLLPEWMALDRAVRKTFSEMLAR